MVGGRGGERDKIGEEGPEKSRECRCLAIKGGRREWQERSPFLSSFCSNDPRVRESADGINLLLGPIAALMTKRVRRSVGEEKDAEEEGQQ